MFWKILLEPDWFDRSSPFLRRKRSAFEIEDLPGLWRIHWQLGEKTILSTFYTRIDQACILWGVISTLIFATAQFCAIDWQVQAILWSGLSLFGTIVMMKLSQCWRTIKPLSDVIDAWVILMLVGIILTDLSIFLSWGEILARLCSLWLGINAIGYVYTGMRIRSRAFVLIGLLNLFAIALLPHVGVWQFLTTGLISGISALLVAELQWDSGDVCAHLKELTRTID
ncbi:MAG: hypothetical protein MUC48_10420 [Leptolyngbya sp. Prado105]|jgi:hypothetical protein|nr:hypothetical protein [Leptolyngbya sp. Prado105]